MSSTLIAEPPHVAPTPKAAPAAALPLAFSVHEGAVENHFYQRGPVAAHLVLTSGLKPRLLVAFPAGNGGVCLTFDHLPQKVALTVEGSLCESAGRDGLLGVSAIVRCSQPVLEVGGAILGSVRTLRRTLDDGVAPEQPQVAAIEGATIIHRAALSGGHHLELKVEPLDGATAEARANGRMVLRAPAQAEGFTFRVTALTDEPPLTPLSVEALLVEDRRYHPPDLQALRFLAYEEKFLAGSWRFLSYFGRDTLLSLRLLLPILQPGAFEAAVGSVLDRLGPDGDVAHEEDVGQWAALRHQREGNSPADPREPIFDYKMIDDDFLLAPVVAEYLLHTAGGRERAAQFLSRRTASGRTYGEALAKNLEFVLKSARPFAEAPSARTLLALRSDHEVGQWRDSFDGLGGGRVPFDVNGALVPAALRAAERLFSSGLLGPSTPLGTAAPAAAAEAGRLAAAWAAAPAFFKVVVPLPEARARLRVAAAELGLDPEVAAAGIDEAVEFPSLALDEQGQPIPVMHSDDGFVLLFTDPADAELEQAARRLLRPFPAGLLTPVGVVVANAAYATDATLRARFSRDHYHGAVIWSWQQALLAAGLKYQLSRQSISARARELLVRAQRALWQAIDATGEWRSSELWSWAWEGGQYHAVKFGQHSGHLSESNAIQLWSTVYLAVHPSTEAAP